MKRRSLGVIGTLALAGTFAMATGSAIAAPSIDLEETYEFTSTTSGSYTLSMIDTSGTLISESICKSVKSAGATTAFRTSGSSHICDVSQSFKSSEISEVLRNQRQGLHFHLPDRDCCLASVISDTRSDNAEGHRKVLWRYGPHNRRQRRHHRQGDRNCHLDRRER